jgi:hypothetical protein
MAMGSEYTFTNAVRKADGIRQASYGPVALP